MNVIFMGTPDYAQKILQKYPKYDFEFVGYSQDDIRIVKKN